MEPSARTDCHARISVAVPLYNEEKNVPALLERLEKVFSSLGIGWEVVFALDPSPDRTENIILDSMSRYPIKMIKFSRRIGKPLSLMAALDHCNGDACVIIDADLQDPPELIADMIRKWQQGFDVVIARRKSRKGESPLYLKAAQTFYWLLEHISEVKIPRDTGDFRLLDARVMCEMRKFRERHGFLRGITALAGFKTSIIDYDRDPRLAGRTQIPILGAVNIALDGIVPFSRIPVRMIFAAGTSLLLIGIIALSIFMIGGLINGISDKWHFFAIWETMILLGGAVLSAMGIIGEYLVRVYEETRDRPLYIIDTIAESPNLMQNVGRSPK